VAELADALTRNSEIADFLSDYLRLTPTAIFTVKMSLLARIVAGI